VPVKFIIALVIGLVIGRKVGRPQEQHPSTIMQLTAESGQNQSQENGIFPSGINVLEQGSMSQTKETGPTNNGVSEKNSTQISRQTTKN